MQYYDQHYHSHFSFDSKEEIENYAKLTENVIVTTEHYDLLNPYSNYEDTIPNYKAYIEEIDRLKEIYPNKFLKGVEIGYTPRDRGDIHEFLDANPYDLILLSIHQFDKMDYMDPAIRGKKLPEVLDGYFGLMYEGIQALPQAHILTHIDYGVRMFDIEVEELMAKESLILDIFSGIIEQGQAFELNSKSMYKYGKQHLYDYLIPLYQSRGGELFTIGSDAHVASDYELRFEDTKGLLRKYGVNELVVYQGSTHHKVSF